MTTKSRVPKEFVPDNAGDIGADFELWLEDVNDYSAICNVSTAADKKRLFLNLAGLSVRKVVKGVVIPSPKENDDGSPGDEYVALTDAVLAHFRPTINTTSERHKFRQLKQGPEESVSTFVGRLRDRVDLCKFGATDVDSVVNSQVRDQLVAGLKSPKFVASCSRSPDSPSQMPSPKQWHWRPMRRVSCMIRRHSLPISLAQWLPLVRPDSNADSHVQYLVLASTVAVPMLRESRFALQPTSAVAVVARSDILRPYVSRNALD